ncbi:Glycogenin-1 [Dermatophagoides pteronyssinus]|uniref:Glycogenin-1 n=1 Tax=Dermatophagoides pteronyssinus TaxID=6956 RepID=A0ABQ8ISW5_DERPT|nr:Glycogenin-1 [Dermatophagoides pteronyssinus]
MEKFKIPDIPKISPIISDKISSSSSMERKPKPKQQQQQQQKRQQQQPQESTTTTTNKEIIIEKKLCPPCSRLLMNNTIVQIQKCLTNLLNIIDNDIINEYSNESRHQQSNPLNNFGHPHQQQHEQQQQIDNQHQINHHQQQQQQQQRQQKIIVDKNTIFQTPLSTTELSTEMMMKNSSNSYFQENYNAVVDVDNLNTEFGSSGDDVRALAASASASASDSINVIIDKNDCPYAYVTIITNNLQAINSIIMANSLYYYNNHNLIIHHQQNDNNKQIKHYYRIPLIIFIQNDDDHHKIDLEIIQLIRRFFDHVIELKSNDLTLLNNKSLGINHQKVHLWKYLSEEKIYTKCIYLESNLLIVGNISNLFIDYMELSACVDCFFIDYFNCSMFVFEPNKQTYRQLIHFGSKSSSSSSCMFFIDCFFPTRRLFIYLLNFLCFTVLRSISNSVVNNNDNLDGNHNLDDEPMDEITLLNEFFHSKWKRLSFIYNYLRNDLSYTQQSAYLSDSNNNDDDNQDEHVLNFDYEQSNQIEQQQEQRCLKNDHQDDVEEEIVTTKQIGINIGRKDEWENGQIDWLHQYQSDRIIDRLLTKF